MPRGRLKNGISYTRLEVHGIGPWIWQVHENQSYLGRLIFRLERHETGSLSRCTKSEWLSLHENIQTYERVLCHLFAPDRFNYSQMGNIYSQLHVQGVPRYKSERTWMNRVFCDKNWGRNWAPTPPSNLTLEETYEFAAWLRGEIQARVVQQ